MNNLVNTDPEVNFISELKDQLRKEDEREAWELKNRVINEPNMNFKISQAVQNTLKEVRLSIDFDFPAEAKSIKTNDEFFKFMERYLPEIHQAYKLSMLSGNSKFIRHHLSRFVELPLSVDTPRSSQAMKS